MAREHDRQMLESITQSFTSDQSKEFTRRVNSVDLLLSRLYPRCSELAAKIEENQSEEQTVTRTNRGLVVALIVWGALWALSIVTSVTAFYFLLSIFIFLLARPYFAPEGPNAVAISTLKILTFTTITRIEELGASERSVFMYVREVTGLNSSLLCEIRKSYLSSEHQLEDYESIVDEDDEGDLESDDEIDTSEAWERICLEIARVVSKG